MKIILSQYPFWGVACGHGDFCGEHVGYSEDRNDRDDLCKWMDPRQGTGDFSSGAGFPSGTGNGAGNACGVLHGTIKEALSVNFEAWFDSRS